MASTTISRKPLRGWVRMRWTSSPNDFRPCCSINLLRRLDTRYCLFSPSKMPQAFSRKTRNCSKSKLPVDKIPPLSSYRSEEHTSELQSLMRISYAVLCLKQKIHKTTPLTTHRSFKQTMTDEHTNY